MDEKNPIAELFKTIFEVVKDPTSLPGVVFIVGAIFSFTAFIIHRSYEVWKRSLVFCIGLILMGGGVYLWKVKEITDPTKQEEVSKKQEEEKGRLEEERNEKKVKGLKPLKGSIPEPPVCGKHFFVIKRKEDKDVEELDIDSFNKIAVVKSNKEGLEIIFKENMSFDMDVTFKIFFQKDYSIYFKTDFDCSGWQTKDNCQTFISESHSPSPFKINFHSNEIQ